MSKEAFDKLPKPMQDVIEAEREAYDLSV